MQLTNFLFIDFQEIVVILVVVVLLFGTKSLPEIARGLGQAVRHFKLAADDIKREIMDPSEINPIEKIKKEVKDSVKEIGTDLNDDVKDIQKTVGSIEGTIKRDA